MKRINLLAVAILISIIIFVIKPYYYQKILAAIGGIGFVYLFIKTYRLNK
jgi:hypothetical protein